MFLTTSLGEVNDPANQMFVCFVLFRLVLSFCFVLFCSVLLCIMFCSVL